METECCSTERLHDFRKAVTKIVYIALAGDCRRFIVDVSQLKPEDIRLEVEHFTPGGEPSKTADGIAVEFGTERKIVAGRNMTFDNERVRVEAYPAVRISN